MAQLLVFSVLSSILLSSKNLLVNPFIESIIAGRNRETIERVALYIHCFLDKMTKRVLNPANVSFVPTRRLKLDNLYTMQQ